MYSKLYVYNMSVYVMYMFLSPNNKEGSEWRRRYM